VNYYCIFYCVHFSVTLLTLKLVRTDIKERDRQPHELFFFPMELGVLIPGTCKCSYLEKDRSLG
jgi:hypothetical protein